MTRREKLMLGVAAVLLLTLAGVAIWQKVRADAANRQLAETRTELALQRHESTLGLAAIEATRGSYELARQLASDFFTGLQAVLGAAPPAAQPELQQMLSPRDAMITALSRSDPQAAPQLVQLLIRYRIALGEPVGPQEPAAAPSPQPAAPADTQQAGR